jgi:hypothetical protein
MPSWLIRSQSKVRGGVVVENGLEDAGKREGKDMSYASFQPVTPVAVVGKKESGVNRKSSITLPLTAATILPGHRQIQRNSSMTLPTTNQTSLPATTNASLPYTLATPVGTASWADSVGTALSLVVDSVEGGMARMSGRVSRRAPTMPVSARSGTNSEFSWSK